MWSRGRSILPVHGWQVIHEGMKAVKNQMLASTVSGGVIPLPRGARLMEGMRVQIVPLDALPGDPPFLKTMLKLADRRLARPRKPAVK